MIIILFPKLFVARKDAPQPRHLLDSYPKLAGGHELIIDYPGFSGIERVNPVTALQNDRKAAGDNQLAPMQAKAAPSLGTLFLTRAKRDFY